MIFAWTAGDVFKIGYALVKKEPVFFALCGAFQLLVDLVILAQIAGVRAVLAAPPPGGTVRLAGFGGLVGESPAGAGGGGGGGAAAALRSRAA